MTTPTSIPARPVSGASAQAQVAVNVNMPTQPSPGAGVAAGKVQPERCPTCCKAVHSPYRVFDARGKVLQGCIDDCHTGHLVQCSESSFWHNRPVAKAHRRSVKAHLRNLKRS